ncbi:MAG: tRNA (adenosine(37)-N6)-threonylcarbamoyltransferase complex dimerization subunit type 1 TsaB, partial [Chitinophagaceae bacterium]
MSLILNIDTTFDKASVCLSNGGNVLQCSYSDEQKEHASWMHAEIAVQLDKYGYNIKDLAAVAVNAGPGSYTGLRVGMAAAKGYCYSLNIPLITINSLKICAFAVKDESIDFICSLIDARRMEVYAAVYDSSLQEKIAPHSLIIAENSFASILTSGKILFCGNGINKLMSMISNDNAYFSYTKADATHLAQMSMEYYKNKKFANLAYIEPLY